MEVKVGIQHITRELTVETDDTATQVIEAFQKAIAEDGLLTLTDTKGGSTLIRAASVAYLDLGKEQPRRVGFGDI
ncbi:DUF3107 domain-containing protein [Granulicoccus sp. GXG6511]|uniref:DUF3107 domain-containing protein n=1 Tax=Granulicoccus sp. GXG6511 TaxID=3381351 RepID=UPI003D7CCBEF